MIIKKPYGFMIKHFKIINAILIVLMVIVERYISKVHSFISAFCSSNYVTSETELVANYMSPICYIAIAILIIGNIIILFLMNSKKKPTLTYIITTIYYILMFILYALCGYLLSMINAVTVSTVMSDLLRDLTFLGGFPAYILIIITFLNAIGFDIKRFRFTNNLDLRITEDDDEEIELKLGNNDYGSNKKRLIRTVRELKYYYLENRFALNIIIVALFVLLFGGLYLSVGAVNQRYNRNQTFSIDTFDITLKNSYLTDFDYQGNYIDDDKVYLTTTIHVKNNYNYDKVVDPSYFRLEIGNKTIYPSYDKSLNFKDLGVTYNGRALKKGEENDFVFAFELDKKDIKSTYKLKILNSLKSKKLKIISNYKILTIRPNNIINKKGIEEQQINKPFLLAENYFGQTNYKLKSIIIDKKYSYKYKTCTSSNYCYENTRTILPSNNTALVIISDEIKWDESCYYYLNKLSDIYTDFGLLYYEYTSPDGTTKTYNTRMTNVTPSSLNDIKIYEVPKLVASSKNIRLTLNIRNRIVSINDIN